MLRPSHYSPAFRRRGVVTILAAVVLVILIGVVAITVDGGLLQDNRRRAQAAADASALAAANVLFKNYASLTTSSPDPGGAAVAAATQAAADNGFPVSSSTAVTVNVPPKSGPFTGKLGYAEVLITYQQPRYFSTIWGSSTIPVKARAVGWGYWGGTGNGVIVLDPTAKNALDASGTGSVKVTGGAKFIVDSNHSEAARVTGGGSMTAAGFNIVGGYTGPLDGPVANWEPSRCRSVGLPASSHQARPRHNDY